MNDSNQNQHGQPLKAGYFEGVNIPDYEKILNCIRCGMCLPHCPTYREQRVERSSPRGRAALIRAVADGKLELTPNFNDEMYLCLDCRACETACPSGVRIGYLIESARSQIQQNAKQNFIARLLNSILFNWLFLRHWRLEWATLPLRLYQGTGLQTLLHKTRFINLLPKRLKFMEALAPRELKKPFRKTIPDTLHAQGEEKTRVGYFLGCMMSLLFNNTTNATVNILRRSHCTVITPKDVRCCAAPLLSTGFKHKAFDLMRFNIDLFDALDVDTIVTDCAACSAALKEYEEFFEDDPEYREKAKRFSGKVREITEFLSEWPHYTPPKADGQTKRKTIYDEPCHLQHAQQVSKQPKQVIRSIPSVELVDLPPPPPPPPRIGLVLWQRGSIQHYSLRYVDETP